MQQSRYLSVPLFLHMQNEVLFKTWYNKCKNTIYYRIKNMVVSKGTDCLEIIQRQMSKCRYESACL